MIRDGLLALAAAQESPRRGIIEQLARDYLDSFAGGDIEARLALFAPDAVFEDPVGAPPVVGHEGLRAFWAAAAGIKVQMRLEHIAVSGDEAAYVFSAQVGEAPDQVTIRTVETIAVNADGLISRMRAYFDRNTMT